MRVFKETRLLFHVPIKDIFSIECLKMCSREIVVICRLLRFTFSLRVRIGISIRTVVTLLISPYSDFVLLPHTLHNRVCLCFLKLNLVTFTLPLLRMVSFLNQKKYRRDLFSILCKNERKRRDTGIL